ncbi:MAG: inositol 2-dehydrogenase [Candidatus Marinimicrobia bacterium]|nr:inositol 2-dehydrogenase [Candidatus Neomarinimicrobiota bacterium]
MSNKKITFGIIGAGRIGKMHAENILANFPQIFLKTVIDLKLDFDWAEKVGIPVRSKEITALTDDPEIDAVVITTPSDTHVQMITLMAEAGKQIFCEKPIAFDPDSIQMAINAVEKAGVILQVGFNRRFDPDFLKVRLAVESGEIGEPHIINMTNRDPQRPDLKFIPGSGGLFMDFCVHDFDMVRFLTGSEVEEIYVRGANLVDPKIGELGDIDTALLTLKMSSGALCIINVCRETNYGYDQQVEVLGSKGSIRAQNRRPTSVVLSSKDGVFMDQPHYSFIERYKDAYIAELKGFINCLETGGSPTVAGHDALKAVQVAVAAQQSLELNQPVSLN